MQSRGQPGIKVLRLATPGISDQLGRFETGRKLMGRLRIAQGDEECNEWSGRGGGGVNDLHGGFVGDMEVGVAILHEVGVRVQGAEVLRVDGGCPPLWHLGT